MSGCASWMRCPAITHRGHADLSGVVTARLGQTNAWLGYACRLGVQDRVTVVQAVADVQRVVLSKLQLPVKSVK